MRLRNVNIRGKILTPPRRSPYWNPLWHLICVRVTVGIKVTVIAAFDGDR